MTHNVYLKIVQLKQDYIKKHKNPPTVLHLTTEDEAELELCSDYLSKKHMAALNSGTHRAEIKKLSSMAIEWDSETTFVS